MVCSFVAIVRLKATLNLALSIHLNNQTPPSDPESKKARKCNTKSCSLVYFDVLRFMEQARKEAKAKREAGKKAQNTKMNVHSQLWC